MAGPTIANRSEMMTFGVFDAIPPTDSFIPAVLIPANEIYTRVLVDNLAVQ